MVAGVGSEEPTPLATAHVEPTIEATSTSQQLQVSLAPALTREMGFTFLPQKGNPLL